MLFSRARVQLTCTSMVFTEKKKIVDLKFSTLQGVFLYINWPRGHHVNILNHFVYV